MDVPRDTLEVEVGRPFRLLKDPPAGDRCERCGAGGDTPLSVARFEAWRIQATRTLCDFCASVFLEQFIETDEAFVEQQPQEGALALIT
jgi:hypothetical protein